MSCYIVSQSVTTCRLESGSVPCLCQHFGGWGRQREEGGEEGVKRGTGGGDGEKGGAVPGLMGSSLTASLPLLGL